MSKARFTRHGYSMRGRQSKLEIAINAAPAREALHKMREKTMSDDDKQLLEEYRNQKFPEPKLFREIQRRGLTDFI